MAHSAVLIVVHVKFAFVVFSAGVLDSIIEIVVSASLLGLLPTQRRDFSFTHAARLASLPAATVEVISPIASTF